MNLNKMTTALLAGFLTLSFAAPVWADTALSNDEAIAKRQELMKSNGQTLRAAGSATGDAAVAGAQTLVDNFTALDDDTLWPEGSVGGESEALLTVWTDNAGFKASMSEALDTASAFLVAAQSGDAAAYGAAAKAMGASCGSCHDTYKMP